ncbi:DNA binding protein isoform X2 [Tasmannia lanceolata]|uniref:DNA binding protein isoform X2 n=1 Tax=Tasmannia lanceolata TaxID=3420 RepID=UPI0040643BB4
MESSDEEKLDGLEINSIGALYKGPWEKKYWSSSRITSMDGESCTGQTPDIAWETFQKKSGPRVKMWHGKRFSCKIDGIELFGFRNPLVHRLLRDLVANVNGIAEKSLMSPNICSGASRLEHEPPSPDLRTYPDLLPYLGKQQSTGKRSRKHKNKTINAISGASTKRLRAQDLLSDANLAIAKKTNRVCCEGHICQDNKSSLLDRSFECEVRHCHLVGSQERIPVALNGELSYPTGQENHSDGQRMTSSTSDGIFSIPGKLPTVPVPVGLTALVEGQNGPFLVKDELLLKSPKCGDNSVDEPVFSQEQSNLVDPGDSRIACVSDTLSKVNKKFVTSAPPPLQATTTPPPAPTQIYQRRPRPAIPHAMPEESSSQPSMHPSTSQLDRSSDANFEGENSLPVTEGDDREIPFLKGFDSGKDLDHYVSDTLDILQEYVPDFASESYKGSHNNITDEPMQANQLVGNLKSHDPHIVSNDTPNALNSECGKCASKSINAPPTISQDMSCPVTCTQNAVLSEGMITGLHPEEEIGGTSGTSNESSQKSECDSVGQELLKSMMTVLLPRALPLLKKTSKKKKAPASHEETSFIKYASCFNLDGDGAHHLTDAISRGTLAAGIPIGESKVGRKGEMTALGTLLGTDAILEVKKCDDPVGGCITNMPLTERESPEDGKSVIPDTFEDDQSAYDVSNCKPLHSDFCGADPTPFEMEPLNPDIMGMHGNAVGDKESLTWHFGSEDYNGIFSGEGAMLPERPIEKGENLISVPSVGFISPSIHIPLKEKVNDSCGIEAQPKLKSSVDVGIKIVPHCIEGMLDLELIRATHNDAQHSHVESLCKSEIQKISPTHKLPNSLDFGDGPTKRKFQCTSFQDNLADSDIPKLSMVEDKLAANLKGEEGSIRIPVPHMEFDGKTEPCNSSSLIRMLDAAASSGEPCFLCHEVGEHPCLPCPSRKYHAPLSESIICRNIKDNVCPGIYSMKSSPKTEFGQASDQATDTSKIMPFVNETKIGGQPNYLNTLNGIPESEGRLFNLSPLISRNQPMVVHGAEGMHNPSFVDPFVSDVERHSIDAVNEVKKIYSDHKGSDIQKINAYSDLNPHNKLINNNCEDMLSDSKLKQKSLIPDNSFSKVMKPNNEIDDSIELVGCYLHPTPVLSMFLSTMGDDIRICVLCGLLKDKERTLFIYKIPSKESRENSPSFIGYTLIMLPISHGPFDRDTAFERSGLEFTPDGQFLVLLSSVKAPCCREQSINCTCSVCMSDCCEENGVRVVHVELGYVSFVSKLTTTAAVHCILVCEPRYLVAVEGTARLHVWIMDSTWSADVEEFVLPTFDYSSTSILELRRLPMCVSLVIGHDGAGGFGLWDISKRVFLARFSAPGSSIFEVLPVGLFNWQKKGPVVTSSKVDDYTKEIIDATEKWFSGAGENHAFLPSSGEDIAVWLLVSAVSNSEAQLNHHAGDLNKSSAGWRLALLVKNMVVMGSILDPRASAAGVSRGHGIIGTCDGLVYKWELSTGIKLADLHHLKGGGGVSCIATDAKSGALAVAGDECQLLLYRQSSRDLPT